MSEKDQPSRSIYDQIFEAMLADLAEHKAFDPSTIERLRALASHGHLTSQTRILQAIKFQQERES